MTLDKDELNALANELAQALDEYPRRVEVVAVTGEMLSVEAMRIARIYDAARNGQRVIFDSAADLIISQNGWEGPK